MNENTFTRPRVNALDSILGVKHPVLDHGFIRVVDYMGDWRTVANCARQSFQGEETEKSEDADKALIRRLMRDNHTSPFEACEIRFQMALPVMVARQFIRHRTANVNEWSGRYSQLPDVFYVPDLERMQKQSLTNKQGSGEQLDKDTSLKIQKSITRENSAGYSAYEHLLSSGLTKELARNVLNLGVYTCWSFKIDLHNLLHLLKLRDDPHAQWECREYAKTMASIVRLWVPPIYEAYENYQKKSLTFSAMEIDSLTLSIPDNLWEDALARLANNSIVSKSEYFEFLDKVLSINLNYGNRKLDVAGWYTIANRIWENAHKK